MSADSRSDTVLSPDTNTSTVELMQTLCTYVTAVSVYIRATYRVFLKILTYLFSFLGILCNLMHVFDARDKIMISECLFDNPN